MSIYLENLSNEHVKEVWRLVIEFSTYKIVILAAYEKFLDGEYVYSITTDDGKHGAILVSKIAKTKEEAQANLESLRQKMSITMTLNGEKESSIIYCKSI